MVEWGFRQSNRVTVPEFVTGFLQACLINRESWMVNGIVNRAGPPARTRLSCFQSRITNRESQMFYLSPPSVSRKPTRARSGSDGKPNDAS